MVEAIRQLAMPRISVLIPTHEHASTLRYAVRSVLTQGVDDLEILICGDGVSNELRAVIDELQRAESRIRFFDLPKAPSRGELNRDHVLRHAKDKIVCYQSDDDLWLPGHIEVLEGALEDADFVGAMQVNVGTDGKVRGYYFDLESPEFVEPWLDWRPNNFGSWASNGFSPIFVAHRLEAFLRLPEGWTTTPAGLPADQAMWQRFLRQPWCRAKFLRWPIALHFPAPERRGWAPEQRAEELRHWTDIIESPDYAVRIWRDLLPDLGDRLLSQSLKERGPRLEAAEERVRELEARLDAEREVRGARIRELEKQVDAIIEGASAHAMELQTRADAERTALVARIRELENQVGAIREATAAQVGERQGQVSDLQAQVVALQKQVIELQMKAGAEQAAAAAAESERNAMLSSTSWRITAPLRRAVDRLRRLRSE